MFTHLKKLLKLENKWMDNDRNDFVPIAKSDSVKKVKATQIMIIITKADCLSGSRIGAIFSHSPSALFSERGNKNCQ